MHKYGILIYPETDKIRMLVIYVAVFVMAESHVQLKLKLRAKLNLSCKLPCVMEVKHLNEIES